MTKRKQVNKRTEPARKQTPNNKHVVKTTQTSIHQGPLPVANQLNDYNIIVPGAAERIIQMAEKDQKHVHEMEKAALDGQKSVESRGQNYAITAVGMALGVVAYMSYLGHPKEASVLGVAVIVGLAVAFITGKKK